ncbi:MAG: sulfate/molybdate ABC transporter ATP-binding protein [Acidimicrobiia bacterium]
MSQVPGDEPAGSGLDASIRLPRGRLEVDVALRVDEGATVAVLGPNGAGKTSVLRVLAGLLAPDDGAVSVDGVDWDRPATGRRLAPEARSVGFVFQDYLLFPHLTAADNVAYGLRRRGVGRADARKRASGWLERVGLDGFGGRRPDELSGGQRQRVALARALAPSPRLLLLDEPLAALDVTTRGDVRRDLRAHLDDFPGMAVVVTHDPLDAVVLADRIVVMEEGRVVQEGTALEVTSRPRSAFAADIAGLNLFRGTAQVGRVRVTAGLELVTSHPLDGPVFAAVHPRAVALHLDRPRGSARNVWPVTVDEVDLRAGLVRLRLLIGGQALVAEITAASYRELGLAPGHPAWASLKATEIDVFPA